MSAVDQDALSFLYSPLLSVPQRSVQLFFLTFALVQMWASSTESKSCAMNVDAVNWGPLSVLQEYHVLQVFGELFRNIANSTYLETIMDYKTVSIPEKNSMLLLTVM